MKSWPKNHISGYVSGTGNRHHDPFTLDPWPYFGFQTSPSLPKSVQPSPRKRCEIIGSWPKNHISDYISGTGSRYHDPFKIYLWPHFSFQKSPRLSKSVERFPRKRCEFNGSRPINDLSGYNSGTGSRRHNLFTLVQCPYSTFRMSLRLFKSVQPSLRKRCEKGYTYIQTHIHTQTFPSSTN